MTTEQRAAPGAELDTPFVRALFEHSADMVSVIAPDGTLLFHYPPTVLGYFGGENFGRGIFDFLHPDDVPAALERFSNALEGEGPTEPFECRVKAADGTWRWMEVVGNNRADDPSIGGLVINCHDISSRKSVIEALRHSEERFRSLVQHSTDIIAVISADARLLYASPSTEALLGYPDGSLIELDAFELIHPDDQEIAFVTLAGALEDADSHPKLELRVKHADGSWRNVEYVASNRLDDPSVMGVVLNGRDVTERRRAADIEREQNARFRALVQHGSDIIVVLDHEGSVQYVSESVVHIMGYQPDEVIEGAGLTMVHPDDVGPLSAHYAAVLATPGYHGPYQLRSKHADGSWRWLEVVHTNLLDDPAVQGVVLNFRDVTERKEVEDQLAHQALHDSLTGLPNRVLLADRLDHALTRAERDHSHVGVMFMDLDRFKLVNDTRGHVAGDALLQAVAQRLLMVTRISDTVARFGGDEFVVVDENIEDMDELIELGTRLCETMSAPYEVDGAELRATISVGVAIGHPGCSAEVLLRDADAAMYNAKERGGGVVVAFDDSIRERAQTRFETERALHGAVDREEFGLVYQPVVDLESGRICSMEALVRWDHPEQGTILPGNFIDLAEETGLIVPMGRFVLDRATEQLAEWRAIDPELEVSINVSAVQLTDAAFVDRVREAICASSIEPDALNLEITESLLIEDTSAYVNRLEALKEIGVQLTVDDFGTRYSSLSYLNRLPFDGLKIDRSFVHQLGTQRRGTAIASAIVAMAEALGISVVAEGVETEEERRQLLALGCTYAQGFLFAKPARADTATGWVEAGAIPLT